MSIDRITEQVAVITGASSGIGEATARALAADGHRLALLARRVERVEALAAELGDGSLAIEADVTDRHSVVAAAERVQSELGGADILVNNVGVMLLAPFSSDQQAETRQMVETNLLGAMTATEVSSISSSMAARSSTALPWPGALQGQAPRSITRPSGGSTAFRTRCARSSSPMCA